MARSTSGRCRRADGELETIARLMKPTTIMAIAALHQFHAEHPTYGYDLLYRTVDGFQPDYMGVEIRAEDIGADRAYLQRNYPVEMIQLSQDYADGRCFGFDWLGDDIAGQPIPCNYWREVSPYKKLERELGDDPDVVSDELKGLLAQQAEILGTATPASLVDGRYGAVTRRYYQCLDAMLRGTRYELLAQFRRRRDQEIGRNIRDFVQEHRGTRIALVMGANHLGFAVESLSRHLSGEDAIFERPR
jgi:hypothetical protein